MSKFAKYNTETFKIEGFYSKDVHGDNIPENVISITDSKWQEILSVGTENFRVDLSSNKVIPYIKPIHEKIENLYIVKKSQIKNNASKTITNKYPIYKQQNLTNDSEISKYSIQQLEKSYSNNIDTDTIIKNITFFVGLDYTLESLTEIENNINTLDISILTQNTHQDILSKVTNYYRQLILSYVVYRKIEIVRAWSNTKEMEINDIYNSSTLSDEDKLSLLENFNTNIEIVL